jgi:hypothetical protein
VMAAVLIRFDDPDLPREWEFERMCRQVWLIEVDENYSLDAVQANLVDKNLHCFGEHGRVSCEIARFKSPKKLIAWAKRKGRNEFGLPPLTGWHGPVRLAKMERKA